MKINSFCALTKKLVLAMALVLLFSPVAFAATQLTVWHAYRGEEKSAFEKAIGKYNEKMASEGISVKPLAIPYDAYADKITAAVPRGRGPDVFIFAQDRLGGWVEAGNTVEPIDFYLDEDLTEQFLESTVQSMIYQDVTYGLPLNYKCIAMFYNKELIKTPPKTSGELIKVAKSLTDAGAGKFGLVYDYANFFFHSALMNGFGGRVFEPGPKPVLNNKENVASMHQLMTWFKKDGVLPAEPSTALTTSLFNNGKVGMVFNGPWFLGELSKDLNYGLAVLPTLDEANGTPMKPWMTVEGVYIAAPSKHKDEAFDFVQYITSVEAGKIMALEGAQLPANKAVYDIEAVQNNPLIKVFKEQASVAVPMPNYPEMSMIWSPATTAMNTIVKGTASPEEALEKAQKSIQEAVAKLRKGK